ncbi:MAG: hypothetical protein HKP55_06210 [Gammaproteobacteria bacterium]|nr:hypothetical protein [Gammaproteobacteria bacterium]
MSLNSRFKTYYLTAIFSVIFAVVGFSYNAWRLEVSESNNNIRTASFEVLSELAELEQIIFTRHYDNDLKKGNPRIGWVKVGLIVDMSMLISADVQHRAESLKNKWGENWGRIGTDQKVVDELSNAIDQVRTEIKFTLSQLR